MARGTLFILIILPIALIAAAFSLWYHYRNQDRAQEFWGTTTAVLIDKAPEVEVIVLGAPGTSAVADNAEAAEEADRAAEDAAAEKRAEGAVNAEGDAAQDVKAKEPEPEPAGQSRAVEFNDTAWSIVSAKDAKTAKGINNLRRALVLNTTYDWDVPRKEVEPVWKYAVAVNDGKNFATVLFDFDSQQVALAGGRKTAQLNAMAADDFKRFFDEQFPPEEKEEKDEGGRQKDEEGKEAS